mmetsp:Transcript_22169/g.33515  ORF Transcript_22169/g.33515 Transcript_22169/m.33515 type:complete len:480 (-) Transcript_22169:160-1599(-)
MSSPSPPPNNPAPLTIGRTFLKQYYHVLTTSPDMIYKFYRPSSVLSHGEGNNPTIPTTLESLGASSASEVKDRFFSWADSSGAPIRFELEHGAIDAQESVGGGILLVVTGHLYLGDSRKSFCHTFFLDVFSAGDSKKRQYYVHNDVLRFLQEEAPLKESALTSVAEEDEEETVVDESLANEPEPSKKSTAERKVAGANGQGNNDANMCRTEDNKDEKMAESDNVVSELSSDTAEELSGEAEDPFGGESEHKEEEVEESDINERTSDLPEKNKDEMQSEASDSKPPAGSWASLVARSGNRGNGGSTDTNAALPPTPEPTASKEKQTKKDKKHSSVADTVSKGNDQKQRYKRDPESTLVIKNVPDGTKEADIRILFETFATATKTKIIGITVAHRGLAFVDYDSTAPVLAALEKKDQFFLNKKQLEIGQKTADRNRNKGGNSSRSSSSRGRRDGNSNQRQRNNGGQRDRSSGRNQKGGAKN